jgi:membrane protease YdiL (CAAX protease family)
MGEADGEHLVAPAGRSPLGQFAAFAAVVLASGLGIEVQLGAVLVLAALLPPAVAWRPFRPLATLAVYLPFAALWLLFLVGYLRAMAGLGAPVAPQDGLVQLAEHGLAGGREVLLVGLVVGVVPVLEEIVYRGWLFAALDAVLPRPLVHLLTAAAFGLGHGAAYALPIGVLSLCFGWLRARHGSLLPAILAHCLHNGLTVAAVVLWPDHLALLYPR